MSATCLILSKPCDRSHLIGADLRPCLKPVFFVEQVENWHFWKTSSRSFQNSLEKGYVSTPFWKKQLWFPKGCKSLDFSNRFQPLFQPSNLLANGTAAQSAPPSMRWGAMFTNAQARSRSTCMLHEENITYSEDIPAYVFSSCLDSHQAHNKHTKTCLPRKGEMQVQIRSQSHIFT